MSSSEEFVMLSLCSNEKGQTIQSLNFSVGSDKLKAQNVSQLQQVEFRKKLIENVESFRQEFLLNFALIYAMKPDPNFKLGDKLLFTATTFDDKTDTVGFNMIFRDSETWNYFHPSSKDDSKESNLSFGLLITNKSRGAFPFSSQVTLSDGKVVTVGERYMSAYTKALKDLNLTLTEEYKPDFIYDYATSSSHLKSDSNYTFFADDLNHHIWVRSFEKMEGEITLYLRDVNMALCYSLILFVCLTGLGIALFVIKKKEKKK